MQKVNLLTKAYNIDKFMCCAYVYLFDEKLT